MTYADEDEVRDAFWAEMPSTREFIDARNKWLCGASQNALPTDVRCAFVDFVDYLQKSGQISEELAYEVTL